jgi:hypothetical protein
MEDRFRFIPRQETPLPEEFGYDGQWLIPSQSSFIDHKIRG